MTKIIGIVLLAAGKSERFRRATGRHKLLEILPVGQVCVFEQSINNIKQTDLSAIAILNNDDVRLQEICQKSNISYICINSTGMGESIAAGVKATKSWTGWIITLADMPFINSEIYNEIALKVAEGRTARPIYQGQYGHPVGFHSETRQMLENLKEEQGARKILETYPPFLIEIEDVGCIWDIDFPEQLTQHPLINR